MTATVIVHHNVSHRPTFRIGGDGDGAYVSLTLDEHGDTRILADAGELDTIARVATEAAHALRVYTAAARIAAEHPALPPATAELEAIAQQQDRELGRPLGVDLEAYHDSKQRQTAAAAAKLGPPVDELELGELEQTPAAIAEAESPEPIRPDKPHPIP